MNLVSLAFYFQKKKKNRKKKKIKIRHRKFISKQHYIIDTKQAYYPQYNRHKPEKNEQRISTGKSQKEKIIEEI